MDCEAIVKNILEEKCVSINLISNTSNIVYKIIMNDGKTLYVKFYKENSAHIDHELKLYNLVDKKYLKELCYSSANPKMAIFKELVGKTIDELSEEELKNNSNKIVSCVCEYFNSISSIKVKGYGLLDNKLQGRYEDFYHFLKERQQSTSKVLKDYKELSDIADRIFKRYENIIYADNALVPIDMN